jgi:hypothetical protein
MADRNEFILGVSLKISVIAELTLSGFVTATDCNFSFGSPKKEKVIGRTVEVIDRMQHSDDASCLDSSRKSFEL